MRTIFVIATIGLLLAGCVTATKQALYDLQKSKAAYTTCLRQQPQNGCLALKKIYEADLEMFETLKWPPGAR